MLIFLNKLPSCLGATDATADEIRETLRKSPAIVHMPNALFLDRAIVKHDGDCHVMGRAAFIAKGEEAVLNCWGFNRKRD